MTSASKKRKINCENVILPSKPSEFSSNWKNLKKTLRPGKKLKNMNKQNGQEDIWFDNVDPLLIEPVTSTPTKVDGQLVKPKSYTGLTKAVAIDCEMVGVGSYGRDSILARVSIVNRFGQCLYDKYVRPTEKVVDYRTAVSGIRPADLEKGEDFKVVQKEVSDILKGRILVGHAVHHDLKVLYLDHPRRNIRDTSRYKPFRKIFNGGIPSLKRLTETLVGVKVQEGEHNSVQDAQATMRLYTLRRIEWEKSLKAKFKY